MTASDPGTVTRLLAAVGDGDASAREALWSLVYAELHRLAMHQMADEAPGRTLQPTALVHEAYLRLMGGTSVPWSSRRHFFWAAARAMRQIRVDDARRRKRQKRGGGERPEQLVDVVDASSQDPAELLAVSEALDKLEREDPRKAEIVMLKYFVGLTGDEIAHALNVSPRTVDSDWRFARLWLHRELTVSETTQQERPQ